MFLNLRLKEEIFLLFVEHQMSYWHNMCPIDGCEQIYEFIFIYLKYMKMKENYCNDIFNNKNV